MVTNSSSSNVKVLVVDDEQDLREVTALNIEIEGYEVLTASSGNEALSLLEKNNVDLIISDIRMADGDGITLVKTLKEKGNKLPLILLVTGFSEITKSDAIKLGAYDLLEKPADPAIINRILTKLTKEKSAR
jgi:DNA-binding NtrC family response regulator